MTPYYQDSWVTIYHGDCREVLQDRLGADLILTDPPYGKDVKYGPAYDDSRETYWQWFLPALEYLRHCAATMIFTHANDSLQKIRGHDWTGAWVKPAAGGARIGNSPLIAGWEPIYCFGIHAYGTQSKGFPDVFPARPEIGMANVSGIGREKWVNGSADYHPCPKPLDLFLSFIEVFGQGKQLILDPFMGSGTTLRAAKDLQRHAIGIEIEERYCEIAAKRCAQEVLDLTPRPPRTSGSTSATTEEKKGA